MFRNGFRMVIMEWGEWMLDSLIILHPPCPPSPLSSLHLPFLTNPHLKSSLISTHPVPKTSNSRYRCRRLTIIERGFYNVGKKKWRVSRRWAREYLFSWFGNSIISHSQSKTIPGQKMIIWHCIQFFLNV